MLSILQALLGSYIVPTVLTALASALGLILLDSILGVLVAFKMRTFKFSKVPQFMETSFIPYVGGLLILALFTGYPEIQTVFFSITAAIGVKFIADILSKVAQLFSGLGIQIQSPISLKKSDTRTRTQTDFQPVSPQTDTSTNTPAAEKTVPSEDAQSAQIDPQAQVSTQQPA